MMTMLVTVSTCIAINNIKFTTIFTRVTHIEYLLYISKFCFTSFFFFSTIYYKAQYKISLYILFKYIFYKNNRLV